MTQCLIKKNAFTLTELMIAVAFSVLLLTGVYGFYNVSSQSYSSGITGQNLQDGADIVISKIIEGAAESGGTVYRLVTSASYYIPNPNTLYYCQDSPCSAADPTARYYTLDSTNTKVLYYHPTSNPLGYDVIYTAPTGSFFFNKVNNNKTLRFSPAQFNGQTLPNVIEIDVALTENLAANITNQRLTTTSGASSTFLLLRNHQ